MAISYKVPKQWIRYDQMGALDALIEAKASIKALKATPYQRDWVDKLQEIQLKMEVAGTSRIEGAEFTEHELEAAFSQPVEDYFTRSQKQAKAAVNTYRWIARILDDRPIDESLICEIHRRMVTGCDDDHCEPGKIRGKDHNVTFGIPQHRGCEGGAVCEQAFSEYVQAIQHEYKQHDPLIQAIAIHYHFAAMHPFQDGNGRTARALEALVLQRAGLRDTVFIAMSNYYYEEKPAYLRVLAEVRAADHDLTNFIVFALRGVAIQCDRLLREIKKEVQKAVFRNTMFDLFGRLKSPRKRVIAQRQLEILKLLLETERIKFDELIKRTDHRYKVLRDPVRGLVRDLNGLIHLGAIAAERLEAEKTFMLSIRLAWPTEIRETEFIDKVRKMPRAKTHYFLS